MNKSFIDEAIDNDEHIKVVMKRHGTKTVIGHLLAAGEQYSVMELAEVLGLKAQTLGLRIKAGETSLRELSKPPRTSKEVSEIGVAASKLYGQKEKVTPKKNPFHWPAPGKTG